MAYAAVADLPVITGNHIVDALLWVVLCGLGFLVIFWLYAWYDGISSRRHPWKKKGW